LLVFHGDAVKGGVQVTPLFDNTICCRLFFQTQSVQILTLFYLPAETLQQIVM